MAVDLVRTMRAKGMDDASLDRPATVRAVLEHLSVVGDAIKALAERVTEIESRGVKYVGTYQRSGDYERGMLATHKGAMWHAVQKTSDEPGTSAAWQLAVKAGRDGKDAR